MAGLQASEIFWVLVCLVKNPEAMKTFVTEVDGVLGEYRIPAGTMVANCTYLVHHRADIYSASESFTPQRCLDSKSNPH